MYQAVADCRKLIVFSDIFDDDAIIGQAAVRAAFHFTTQLADFAKAVGDLPAQFLAALCGFTLQGELVGAVSIDLILRRVLAPRQASDTP